MSENDTSKTDVACDATEARRQINIIGPALRGLLADGEMLKVVTLDPDVTPDQAGDRIVRFEPQAGEAEQQTIQRLKEAVAGRKVDVVLVPGLGGFFAGADYPSADAVRQAYRSSREVGTLPPPPAGRVAGKVAIVTGAAQGFGLEISQAFAAEGGHVVLADMNLQGAAAAAAAIGPRAMGLAVNVSDGASVEAMIHQVVRHFGGFDVLISNAGVLRAGSVKTLSERDFDFVTSVNYKGFFLCTQKAAPVLAVQRQARADYWSDIIQINSKSGLRGSNKNGAYAGGKFGGIGLVESFALELVADGIKVNAICPGNFYDGPLWSDPKNGLFVQYLNAGKVPGAKTIQDVRRYYEAQAPIRRGCTTADVMKAVYYLIDQQYETGQALPVTGGQVMLK